MQMMVASVTSLVKTVKSVEEEHSRGRRALESTIEAIAQDIRVSFNAKVLIFALSSHTMGTKQTQLQ